ncbi:M50 family metallopeptidase [Shewanella sp. SR44-3]|uniref:M50 family metallopeptidase n=1 Tax=unclassified Shewanella TaxID=196818 RepID=UPI0015FDBC04|nr:M50 family metallopeptidase [Shewanella sp. SR44-3]MBB1270417.1 M50 family metallopeptidase [Shewanella sp. SR44-3]
MPDVGPAISVIPSRSRFLFELITAFVMTRVPYLSVPFKWLESYFHEVSHGVGALLTGGAVSHIQLFPNGAGLCFTQGGSQVVTAFAGYFGAALWGWLIFSLANSRIKARASLGILGFCVLMSLVLWARDLLTIVILFSLLILFLLPLKLPNWAGLQSLLRMLGLMVILNAMASPMVLFGLSDQGDAVKLADLTWIPAGLWVLVWLASSATILWFCWSSVSRHNQKQQ